MRKPEIEGAMFLAACGLLPGPATGGELAARLDWETGEANLDRALGKLRGRRLVESGEMKRRGPDGEVATAYVHRLTELGARAVTETINNYVFAAKKFLEAPPGGDGFEALDFKPADPPARPHRDVHPEPDELDLLLSHAAPELAAPCRLVLAGVLKAEEIGLLAVADFDRRGGFLRLPSRVVPLPDELRRVVEAAVGGREAGPLFPRPRGDVWTRGALTAAFRHARKKASLPPDMVLIGRHKNHLGRRRKAG